MRLLNYLFIVVATLSVFTGSLAHDYDEYNGDEINQVCAGCHGEFGMGGKDGEYPRLAGLPVDYLVKEMKLFRNRTRPNMPMVQHVDERQMPDDDIMDVSIYLNRIKLANRMTAVDESAPNFDAYARLQEAKITLQIGLAKGDLAAGAKLYRKECRSCHGKQGEGDEDEATPQLAGQYTNYLLKQVGMYKDKKRNHDVDDPEEEFLKSFSDKELEDIFAYISTLDD